MPARFKAPTANGDVLAVPDFTAVPRLVEANRRLLDRDDVAVGGMPLRQLRALARRELQIPDGPLVVAGHQPELSHPGVWAKNFALAGLARKVGGTALNLIVDNDTLKSAALRVPVFGDGPASVHLEPLPFDIIDEEVTYEDRKVLDPELFRTLPDRAAKLTANWGYEPLLKSVWYHGKLTIVERFTAMRVAQEKAWGCENRELSVSRLSQAEAFRRFAGHVLADLPRFRDVYNSSIRAYRTANRIRSANHPAPELEPNEIPFWVRAADGRRTRKLGRFQLEDLRPRALTLTVFARVCLGDFFIHGIGGGKYDEVTDAIIRDYFGIDPPAYQVLSGTLHLPLPAFRSSRDDVKVAERHVRDLHWNPQGHLTLENAARPEVRALIADKAALAASEPPRSDRAARREWFRQLHSLTQRLRPFVWKQGSPAKAALARKRVEAAANAVLQRRDFAWVLYPEATLRPFLQQFLSV